MSTSTRQRAAFGPYLAMGPRRSIKALRDLLGGDPQKFGFRQAPSLRTLEDWSTKFGWGREIERIEREALATEAEKHAEHVRSYHERLRQEGLLLQNKGIAWLAAKQIKDVRVQDAIRAIAEGFRFEALSLGQVTERIAVEEQNDGIVAKLSDEELDRLLVLLEAAPGPSAQGAS